MIKQTLTALLIATPATADVFNLSKYHTMGDTASMEMDGEYNAQLTYNNTGSQLSVAGDWPVSAGNLECILTIETTSTDETATPTCPAGWIVHPETADVKDGDYVTFWISWGAF